MIWRRFTSIIFTGNLVRYLRCKFGDFPWSFGIELKHFPFLVSVSMSLGGLTIQWKISTVDYCSMIRKRPWPVGSYQFVIQGVQVFLSLVSY